MEKQNKILIIDDDILISSALRRLLHVLDADITVTQDPAYGLELATQNHAGKIEVKSTQGEGTSFRVLLPYKDIKNMKRI
ncbi:hypothetical protein N8Y82_01985 [Gammaproteobacteria bacterium]|nr:hypothetical protein [Gammaproteobacteria bacterium]